MKGLCSQLKGPGIEYEIQKIKRFTLAAVHSNSLSIWKVLVDSEEY